jgi:uncharacterized membrane protein YjgN (DUF898 family)
VNALRRSLLDKRAAFRPSVQPWGKHHMVEGKTASAFRFHGSWQDFARIVIPNILLTIVTLGIYRFWATTRERQYLWGQTDFIDERLEWTGRGLELFIGFVMAVVLILIPFFLIQFATQALVLQGYTGWAGLLTFAMFGFIMYMIGIARFRALRYRLSRTYWHGIRGGSDDQGFGYGWSYIWKTIVGYLAFGLMVPWSMMDLWNERWNKMSFGPHKIEAVGNYAATFKRYLLFYLMPFVLFVGGTVAGGMFGASGMMDSMMVGIIVLVFGFYIGLGLVALAYYAKFFRVAVEGMSLHKLDFAFPARTMDWFKLFVGDTGLYLLAALPVAVILGAMGLLSSFEVPLPSESTAAFESSIVIVVLAFSVLPFALIGPFIRYRHWKFFVTHMEAYGEVNLDELTQSETVVTKHGEGLLDAFDVGAI